MGQILEDPVWILGELEALPWSEEEKKGTRRNMYAAWRRHDVETFASFAQQLPMETIGLEPYSFITEWPKGYKNLGADLGVELFESGFTRELEVYDSRIPPHSDAREAIRRALREWALENPVEVEMWLQKQANVEIRDLAITSLLAVSARTDPVRASQYYARLGTELARSQAASALLSGFVDRDPLAALSWLKGQPLESLPNGAYQQLFQSWARQDVERAMTYFPRDLPIREQQRIVGSISRHFHEANVDLTTAWLASLDPEVSGQAALGYAQTFAKVDPEGVLAFLENHPKAQHKGWIQRRVFSELAESDVELAMELTLLSEGSVRDQGVSSVASYLIHTDPRAFESWINQDGWSDNQVNEMRKVYAEQMHYIAPEASVNRILNTEKNAGRRLTLMSYSLYSIGLQDPQKAYDMVMDDTRITDSERKELLKRLKDKHLLPK